MEAPRRQTQSPAADFSSVDGGSIHAVTNCTEKFLRSPSLWSTEYVLVVTSRSPKSLPQGLPQANHLLISMDVSALAFMGWCRHIYPSWHWSVHCMCRCPDLRFSISLSPVSFFYHHGRTGTGRHRITWESGCSSLLPGKRALPGREHDNQL